MNETIIFTILLPPMLFAQGYTFRKNSFIKNIRFIIVFGVVGTFISYVVVSALVYAANDLSKSFITLLRFDQRCQRYKCGENSVSLVSFVIFGLSVQHWDGCFIIGGKLKQIP